MFTLHGFFIGITLVVLGVLGVKYTFWLHNVTGPQNWLEHYTGAGTTYPAYKIISTLLVGIGVLVATGFGGNVMNFIFAPILNIFIAH